MSLPSIPAVRMELGLTGTLSVAATKRILVEAMRRDLPLAVTHLHQKAHDAQLDDAQGDWIEDPNSPLGKQLIRLHASDALRPLASEHFCQGMELTFINCCNGKVGKPPMDVFALQIAAQDGTYASADC